MLIIVALLIIVTPTFYPYKTYPPTLDINKTTTKSLTLVNFYEIFYFKYCDSCVIVL